MSDLSFIYPIMTTTTLAGVAWIIRLLYNDRKGIAAAAYKARDSAVIANHNSSLAIKRLDILKDAMLASGLIKLEYLDKWDEDNPN